jgi:ABC-type branched-subunit amino acid transport system permease subunit
MGTGGDIPEVPARPDEGDRPRVGVDEWVANVEDRREERAGIAGLARRIDDFVPPWARLAAFGAVAASLPLWMDRGDLFAYGIFTLIYVLLGLGLNVVVGYAGLLDLGYVAFFGFGAYFYALLSSEQYGIHWPSAISFPVVVVSTAVLGLVLGIPSRRLLGDYLAIVTLFFGQAFVVFVNAANPTVHGKGLTGGPNGIADIDANDLFGYELTTRRQQYWFILGVVLLVLIGLHFLSESRTGRAWRALREDPLAAEAMSMPVNRLKLMAFAFGAGIAGLTGCMFAAVLTAVTSGNFALPILITIYAAVILGGIGSLTGVVIGAIVINVSFQFLAPENPQDNARILFYAVIVLLLVLGLRPWWLLAAVLGGTLAFGVVAHTIAEAISPSWTAGAVVEGGRFGDVIADWVIIPAGHEHFANAAYIALIVAILALTRVRGWWRTGLLVPTIYLSTIVWETSFVEQPAVARWILFGALLVFLMTVRPQGLLGTPRVEIV